MSIRTQVEVLTDTRNNIIRHLKEPWSCIYIVGFHSFVVVCKKHQITNQLSNKRLKGGLFFWDLILKILHPMKPPPMAEDLKIILFFKAKRLLHIRSCHQKDLNWKRGILLIYSELIFFSGELFVLSV